MCSTVHSMVDSLQERGGIVCVCVENMGGTVTLQYSLA